jgi:hypothetical protein
MENSTTPACRQAVLGGHMRTRFGSEKLQLNARHHEKISSRKSSGNFENQEF